MTSIRCLTLMVGSLATIFFAASRCPAAPQVAFAVKDNWVTLAIKSDGVPICDASIKVIDDLGQPFATGETGQDGQGEFPLPLGPSFIVEIKLGKRTADLVRLTREGDGLFPSEVQLTFGLAPCCRVPSRSTAVGANRFSNSDPDPDPASSWRLAGAVVGSAFVVSMIAVTVLLPRRGRPH